MCSGDSIHSYTLIAAAGRGRDRPDGYSIKASCTSVQWGPCHFVYGLVAMVPSGRRWASSRRARSVPAIDRRSFKSDCSESPRMSRRALNTALGRRRRATGEGWTNLLHPMPYLRRYPVFAGVVTLQAASSLYVCEIRCSEDVMSRRNAMAASVGAVVVVVVIGAVVLFDPFDGGEPIARSATTTSTSGGTTSTTEPVTPTSTPSDTTASTTTTTQPSDHVGRRPLPGGRNCFRRRPQCSWQSQGNDIHSGRSDHLAMKYLACGW